VDVKLREEHIHSMCLRTDSVLGEIFVTKKEKETGCCKTVA
jgi:hypothetical protein